METIIETRGLTKSYRWKEAVHDLDIRLTAGRACAFLGRNGAGKTTTIKMLAGLIHPTSAIFSGNLRWIPPFAPIRSIIPFTHLGALQFVWEPVVCLGTCGREPVVGNLW